MSQPGPYPQQYPGQNPYQPHGQYQAPPPRGMSIASMVLGIVSIFAGFTFVVPIVGLVLGIIGLQREPAGKGMAIAGLILNGLMLLGWLLLIAAIIFLGGIFATMDYSSTMNT
ncbi:MAG: DUF4190 domain-containing protein [Arthrobacter sp.]|uniref:DUF4190 domain-containing protein n=1 Tax=unclassified Arthrobacter TaxID=235627 RepID=UPI002653E58F|nr:DUF4190 domain-containing protein [Micrococcaceae bacterium]MDN5824560.1 DUF4190 domain-containing protein [Micrococcaceae bacterium]MDN5906294.1 DUF4190 domain-containing protein [Micrococcaceae bacterium]MDN6300656.1 DUF4190 domain-containing protein [Micrococcaceae bacterium]